MDCSEANSEGAGPGGRKSAATFGRCPTHWLIRQLADRWSLPVLSTLRGGPRRFSELLLALKPISHRMLDRTLKKLIQIGLITRTIQAGVPPLVRYELSELGRTLTQPLSRLVSWSKINIDNIEASRSKRVLSSAS